MKWASEYWGAVITAVAAVLAAGVMAYFASKGTRDAERRGELRKNRRPLPRDRVRAGGPAKVPLRRPDPPGPGAARGRARRTWQTGRARHRRGAPARRRLSRGLALPFQRRQTAPFCLLLLGQPTLRRRLRLGAFAALDQRVGLRYTITGLEPPETAAYIAHHLALAGRSDTIFSDDATALIHQVSRGLPRVVNNLATQALIATFAAGKAIVDESAARQAVAEVSGE
jgi:hypothetical protein